MFFYDRHQPEQTLLYQLVEAHYPALVEKLGKQLLIQYSAWLE